MLQVYESTWPSEAKAAIRPKPPCCAARQCRQSADSDVPQQDCGFKGAIAVDDDGTHWETLLHAGRRRKIGLNDLIERVRDKRMTVGQRNGESGFHGIVVPKSEVEAITPKPGTIHGTASEELRGMAAAAFRRSIGLRDGGVFQALIEAGHVSARRIINPRTKRKQYWMEPEDRHVRILNRNLVSAEAITEFFERNTVAPKPEGSADVSKC